MVLTQIVDGEYVVVAPDTSATREPVIPRTVDRSTVPGG